MLTILYPISRLTKTSRSAIIFLIYLCWLSLCWLALSFPLTASASVIELSATTEVTADLEKETFSIKIKVENSGTGYVKELKLDIPEYDSYDLNPHFYPGEKLTFKKEFRNQDLALTPAANQVLPLTLQYKDYNGFPYKLYLMAVIKLSPKEGYDNLLLELDNPEFSSVIKFPEEASGRLLITNIAETDIILKKIQILTPPQLKAEVTLEPFTIQSAKSGTLNYQISSHNAPSGSLIPIDIILSYEYKNKLFSQSCSLKARIKNEGYTAELISIAILLITALSYFFFYPGKTRGSLKC